MGKRVVGMLSSVLVVIALIAMAGWKWALTAWIGG